MSFDKDRIRVIVEFIPAGQGSINYGTSTFPQGNNNSNPDMTVLNTAHTGRGGFILGASRLGSVANGGDGHVFVRQGDWYKGFMGSDRYIPD